MGELNMEDMPLPSLFEQSRKIHLAATESAVDQVSGVISGATISFFFGVFRFRDLFFFSEECGDDVDLFRIP